MKRKSPEAIKKAYQRIYEEIDDTEAHFEFMQWLHVAGIVLFQYSEEDGGFIPVLPGFIDSDMACAAFFEELQDQETEEFGDFFGVKQ